MIKSQAFLRKRFSCAPEPFLVPSTSGESSREKSYCRKSSKILTNKRVITAIEAHFWQIQERTITG
jgi:hypothetical protein